MGNICIFCGKLGIFCKNIQEQLKIVATHSSILAWRIPWTEELRGLQSMGLKELETTQ